MIRHMLKRQFCELNKNFYNLSEIWKKQKSNIIINNLENEIYQDIKDVDDNKKLQYFKELNKLGEYEKAIELNRRFRLLIDTKNKKNFSDESNYSVKFLKYENKKNSSILDSLIYIFAVMLILKSYNDNNKDTKESEESSNNLMDKISIIKDLNNEIKPEKIENISFNDVLGIDEYKEELEDIIDFLKNPEKFKKLGANIPKGILITGPPGTGKTLLARALAGESKVPFFYKSGSEFEEIFVGVGASRVKKLFQEAKKFKSAIIFIDEIDSLAGKRKDSESSLSRQTINQILTEMDGFESSDNIIVIGATNFEESLDPAIKRSGRFDKIIKVTPPSLEGRKKILKYYLDKITYDKNLDYENWAKRIIGFTGSDIKNFVNIAILNAIKHDQNEATEINFDFSYDRIQMGMRDRNKMVNKEELISTAYHEIGHAFISLITKGSNPVYKVTILPSGHSLGHTAMIPEKEFKNMDKINILANIDALLGGRMAEEIFFNSDKTTTGVSNDLEKATQLAYFYIKNMGFNDDINLLNHDEISDSYKYKLDKEVQQLLNERNIIVRNKLQSNNQLVRKIADNLWEKETLSGSQLKDIIDSYKIN